MNEEQEAPSQQESSDKVLQEILEAKRKLAYLTEKLEKIVQQEKKK
jgi:flagellar biosynthesis/type III secretory pathway chaperone